VRFNTVSAVSVSDDSCLRKTTAAVAIDSGRRPRDERREALSLTVGEVFNPFNLFDGALVPNQILRCRELLPSEKLVFARLTQFAGANGRAWPSVDRLSEEVSLSIPQTRRCVRGLEEKGFIRRVSRSGRSNEFEFLWHAAYERSERLPRSSAIIQPGSQKITPPQSPVIGPPESLKIASEQSPVIARRESLESSSIERTQTDKSQAQPEARPPKWQPVGDLCRTLFLDEDDNRSRPKRDPLGNPEEEFLQRLRERHGNSVNPEGILQFVLEGLNWQITGLKAFLDFDERQTTAPEKLTNPPGHYRRAVEKFRLAQAKRREIDLRERQRALEKSLHDRRAENQPLKPTCSLSRCDGNGEFWDETGLVSACQCEAGGKLLPAVLDLFEKLNAQRRGQRA
jgi:hypothetical protein